MNWTKHYTGIEFADNGWLYLSRATATKELDLARITIRLPFKKYPVDFGVFPRRLNYLAFCWKGTEVWGPLGLCVGWLRPEKWEQGRRFFGTCWSGSSVKPWEHVGFKVGRLAFGLDSPSWLKRWKEKDEHKKWEEHCNRHDRYEEEGR